MKGESVYLKPIWILDIHSLELTLQHTSGRGYNKTIFKLTNTNFERKMNIVLTPILKD